MGKTFDTERIKQISPDELVAHGYLTKSLNGSKSENKGFCCVYCPSGTGKNKSGGLDFDYVDGVWKHICRSCSNGGDNVRLFQAIYGCGFAEACERASAEFNIPVEDDGNPYRPQHWQRHNSPPPTVGDVGRLAPSPYQRVNLPEKTEPNQVPLIQADIKQAKENLEVLPRLKPPQNRGIDYRVILPHFNCGFLGNWNHPVNVLNGKNFPTRRIIVPTSDNEHYNAIALNIDRKNNPEIKPKMHAGKRTRCFNDCNLEFDTVIFVEGEFDAMSVFQASRLNEYFNPDHPDSREQPLYLFDKRDNVNVEGYRRCGIHSENYNYRTKNQDFGVVATTFAGGWKKLVIAQIDAGIVTKCKNCIIMFDKDDAGRINAEEFKTALEQRGRLVAIRFLYDCLNDKAKNIFGEKVDFNDLLRVEEEKRSDYPVPGFKLKKLIYKIYADAKAELDAKQADRDARHNQTLDFGAPKPLALPAPQQQPVQPLATPQPATSEEKTVQSAQSATSEPQSPPQPVDPAVAQWELENGKINPDVLHKIDNAKKHLESITLETISIDNVQSPQTKNALAYCKFYDYNISVYTHFFSVLDIKLDAVDSQLKLQKATNADLADKDKKLVEWKNISKRDIKSAVDKIINNQIRKAHRDYCKEISKKLQAEAILRSFEAKNEVIAYHTTQITELRQQPQSPERDRQIVEHINSCVEWKLDKQGAPISVKNTAANMHLIFSYDPDISGLFAYDQFQEYYTVGKKAPWHSDEDNLVGELWSDADDARLKLFIRTRYTELVDKDLIEQNLIDYAYRNSFHPVKKFYEAMPAWDGIPRAETIFIKFLGVNDTPMNRAITMNWLMGMFARVYFPGCDYQVCIVLQGAQRIGKSRLLRMLAGEWGVNPYNVSYHVSLTDSFDDSHAIDAVRNAVIVELEENVANKKSDVGRIKQFISAESDTRRFSYDKRAKRVKRHCVFVTTINNKAFLRDVTGNARFYTLSGTSEMFKTVEGMSVDYIRQVLAEAFQKFKVMFKDVKPTDGEKISALLRLPLEIQIANEKNNEQFIIEDGMMSEFEAWVDLKIPPPFIWLLLSKEERSRYCRDGYIKITRADVYLKMRRKQLGTSRNLDDDLAAIDNYLTNKEFVDVFNVLYFGKDVDEYTIHGSDYRQHICPSEIINECFKANDKRCSIARANELFNSLENHGWHVGERFRNDSIYKDQKKILWRDGSKPDTEQPAKPATPNSAFVGTEIDPDDLPF